MEGALWCIAGIFGQSPTNLFGGKDASSVCAVVLSCLPMLFQQPLRSHLERVFFKFSNGSPEPK